MANLTLLLSALITLLSATIIINPGLRSTPLFDKTICCPVLHSSVHMESELLAKHCSIIRNNRQCVEYTVI